MTMDSQIALNKIKDTEKQTQEIIEQAKKAAQQILHDADLEKARIIRQSQEQAKQEAIKLKAKSEHEVAEEVVNIEKQSRTEAEALKTKAKNNLDKAIEFLKSKIS